VGGLLEDGSAVVHTVALAGPGSHGRPSTPAMDGRQRSRCSSAEVRCTIGRMPIYLDHAATTPLRQEVLEAMLPLLTESFGNPSSAHAFGRAARAALDNAHESVARRLNAQGREIVFTSGGTEANNLALKGAAWAGKGRGHRIVTSSVEHHAVGHTLRYLEKFGFEIVELPVDRYGRVDPDALEATLNDKTILVSIMLANNEVGTIQPIAEIAARVRTRKSVLLHVDAVQAAPYVDLDVEALGADLVSLGAHKFEGPKGVGVLYVRHGTHILAQQQGGTQERHRRAGTENVAGAVGFATAYDLSCTERADTVTRLRTQRDRLLAAVLPTPGVEPTGHPKERLPGLVSIVARDTDGASVAMSLDLEGIACSVGSACTTGSTEVSHVLTAMGYPEEEARGALRLSLGRTTTDDEIATACDVVPRVIASMRLGTVAVTADPLGQSVTA
jgi:cysteine desulfurase